MDAIRTDIRRWGRRTVVLVMMVLTLSAAVSPVSATAAVSPPHAPVGPFLTSSSLTSPQFCSGGGALSRTLTPILGVSKGTPAYNSDRPNLKATFEVAPLGQASLVSADVAFTVSSARYQIPAGVLGEGEYRFRVRAVDGDQVSEWLPWCAFTVQTVNVPTPGVPTSLRVSAYPYAGFQYCGVASAPAVSTTFGPTFAASPVAYGFNPNLVGRFEIARPGREPLILAGNLYRVDAPAGSFTPGTYQFRVRAQEGDAVSAWSPWCDFVAE
jgi:hypothetical protein